MSRTFKINNIILFFLITVISINCKGQTNKRTKEYYNKVLEFYNCLDRSFVSLKKTSELFGHGTLVTEEFLFFQKCEKQYNDAYCNEEFEKRKDHPEKYNSKIFQVFRKMKNQFLQGEKDSIHSIVFRSSLYDGPGPSSVGLDVKFPNGNVVYFYLDKYTDEPVSITNIYLTSGESAFDALGAYRDKKDFLRRMGIINDSDGYTNIRKAPSGKAPIVGRFVKDAIFYYTPTSKSSWWPVYKNDYQKSVGYIYKNRILRYPDFPKKLKEKGKRESSGY